MGQEGAAGKNRMGGREGGEEGGGREEELWLRYFREL